MNTLEILDEYRRLQRDVSREADRLNALYRDYMKCRKGCSDCCTTLSLLPLEWFALKTAMIKEAPGYIPKDGLSTQCRLLDDSCCLLYPYRPLICRTHGLPLLYLSEEEDADWQISWCDLNFRTIGEDDMEELFTPEDVLNMEEWNTRLKELNRDFLRTEEGAAYQGEARIPISDIIS